MVGGGVGASHLQQLLVLQELPLDNRVVLLGSSQSSVVLLLQAHDATSHLLVQLLDLGLPLLTFCLQHHLQVLQVLLLCFCAHSRRRRRFQSLGASLFSTHL